MTENTSMADTEVGRGSSELHSVRISKLRHVKDGDVDSLKYFSEDATEERECTITCDNIIAILPALKPATEDREYLIYYAREDHGAGLSDFRISLLIAQVIPLDSLSEYLCRWQPSLRGNGKSRSIRVLVSIGSGANTAAHFYERALKPFLHHISQFLNLQISAVYTESTRTIAEYARTIILPAAQESQFQDIVLLSGDGGVHDLINALGHVHNKSTFLAPKVALVPMGTANALVVSLHTPSDATYGLSFWLRGTPKQLPALKVQFSDRSMQINAGSDEVEDLPKDTVSGQKSLYGAVVCSWGLHASLVADCDSQEFRKFGSERFKMAAEAALFPEDGSGPHQYRAKVAWLKPNGDGVLTWTSLPHDTHAYLLVTMVSNLERTFTISPASKPLDGKMRLLYLPHMSGGNIMRIMNLAYDGGKHLQEQDVTYEEIQGLRIDFCAAESDARYRRICVDGKIIRVEENGWIEVTVNSSSLIDVYTPT